MWTVFVSIRFIIKLYALYIDQRYTYASWPWCWGSSFPSCFILPQSLKQVFYALDHDHDYWIHIHRTAHQFFQIMTVCTFLEHRGNNNFFVRRSRNIPTNIQFESDDHWEMYILYENPDWFYIPGTVRKHTVAFFVSLKSSENHWYFALNLVPRTLRQNVFLEQWPPRNLNLYFVSTMKWIHFPESKPVAIGMSIKCVHGQHRTIHHILWIQFVLLHADMAQVGKSR